MAISEAKRQYSLLDSGFLDSLGSGKEDFVLNEVEKIIVKYIGILVKGYQARLDMQDRHASGTLHDSIRGTYKRLGKDYEVSIIMADYAKYVDKGVQGIDPSKTVNRDSPYKFKFRNPSKAHVAAVEKWIRAKNVTAIVTVPKGLQVSKPKSLAYIFAKAIKRKGLKKSNFINKTMEDILPDMIRDLAGAMARDVSISIKKL